MLPEGCRSAHITVEASVVDLGHSQGGVQGSSNASIVVEAETEIRVPTVEPGSGVSSIVVLQGQCTPTFGRIGSTGLLNVLQADGTVATQGQFVVNVSAALSSQVVALRAETSDLSMFVATFANDSTVSATCQGQAGVEDFLDSL